MKNFTIIMLLSFVFSFQAIGQTQMILPVTFDETNVNYGLVGFGGAEASSIVEDPTLASNRVAKVIKSAGAELWAGTTVTAVTGGIQTGFSTKIPFTEANKKMTVRVWSPDAGIKVRLKVEDHLDPTKSVETEAITTVAAAWETLTFDFGTQAPETAAINLGFNYNKASIFFNFGTTGAVAGEKTYYFDDMAFGSGDEGSGGGEQGENLIINGDFADGLNSWTPFIADFAGVSATVAASEGEASITGIAGAGGEIWHIQLNQILTAAQISALEVGKNYIAKFEARSTVNERSLRLYFGEDGGGFASVSVTDHTLNTETKTIEVPFTLGTKYGAMKFGFEMGLSNDPVFIKNVSLTKVDGGGNGGGSDLELPVTFENADLDYGLTDFGGNASEIVADPTNSANKVAKTVKTGSAELWAGTTVGGTAGFASPISFAEGATKMSLRVWSPTAGIPVRLKVEDSGDPTKSVETEATVTVASEWQTLTFDFANQAAGTEAINFSRNYNKASVFFNFGTTGAQAGEQTYYWDDMAFGSGDEGNGGGEQGENLIINGDFADGLNSWTPFIADFAGVSATVAASEGEASITGIAGAGGEIWHIQLNQILTAAQISALEVGKNYIAKFEARSTVNERSLRLYFGEDGGGFASVSVTDHTLNTETKTIEVPFTLGTKYGAMKFGFEMGLSNDPVFIKNVSLTKVDGGGNGGGSDLELPVTFENADLDYGLTDFGGNASEIVADPTNSTNKVAKTVKTGSAELWAGTTVGGTAGFASPISFAAGATKMSLRVWSPTAGIPVRLKVEDSGDPTKSVETEATVTVASEWQTLTFDFANQAAGTEAINFSRNYNKASVFFNFGTTGAQAGEQTYYWDDMAFGSETTLAEQVITFPTIANKTLGDAPFALNATSTSGLSITYSSADDKVTINGNQATIVKAGRATVTASQGGNDEFLPAESVSLSFCINPVKPSISVSGTNTETVTLTSSAAAGNQWFLNGTAITGAVGQTLAVTTFGTYTVQVKVDDCISAISDEISLIINSAEIGKIQELSVYPNPAESYIHLKGINGPIRSAVMIDMAGRSNPIQFELSNEIYSANVQSLSPGIYVLWIQQGNKSYPLRVIKK
ncbi:carbohydrate binding domain-containing protein [Aquiflexum sp. LQ15W]|uniref:carbohydrate binding domain-containing protein n=1 Tax=Cognataquiflexum nitidum TaxID=2922272 RepID=UPI001F13C53D|nr:carbohydrate binding domain-containing protein [Cognataquiflexum nitidum]MCH6200758.1 carbohydrate binding domain-containing protein [Cognataquiflexum nitidum]